MATSEPIFLNMIKSSIRRNSRYPITQAGFRLRTADVDSNVTSTIPVPNNNYIIATGVTGVPNDKKIKFRYVIDTNHNTRYYLPVNGHIVTDIEVYCKFDIPLAEDYTGASDDTWHLIHVASETANIEFDVNDYVREINVDLLLSTSDTVLSADRLVEKFFHPSAGHTAYNNTPSYFKFFGSGSGDGALLQDTDGNVKFYENEDGVNISDQITVDDIATCTVNLPTQQAASSQFPTKYKLYTGDDELIDEGSLIENSSSPGHNINWQIGDSINFTYTNSVLNKMAV